MKKVSIKQTPKKKTITAFGSRPALQQMPFKAKKMDK